MNQARLLSRLSTRQVEGVLRADAAANEVDAAIRNLWLGLLNHLGPTPNASQIRNAVTLFFKRLPKLAAHETGAALTKSATWGHQTAAEALTLALPTNVLATAAAMRVNESRHMGRSEVVQGGYGLAPHPVAQPLLEDFVSQPGVIAMSYDSQTGNLKLRDRAGRLREPVRDKLSPERQRQIFRDLLFPPPDLATIRDIVFSRFDGATFEDRLARAASLGDAEKIASGVAFAFSQGKNIRQIAKDILPMVDGVRSAARRIARTDSMRVINRSNFDAQNGLGDLIVGWRVAAILDQHSRPWHAARHGKSFFKEPAPGQKGLAQMPHPPEEPEDPRERPSGSPSTAWNCRCLAPWVEIEGRIVAASKVWYSGEMLEIVTQGGVKLSVTPNHPVLTAQGFVRAGSLKKGDRLVRYFSGNEGVVTSAYHYQHRPTKVQEIFRSFDDSGTVSFVGPGAADFHGDEKFTAGKVEIVRPDVPLLNDWKNASDFSKGFGDLNLSWSNGPLRFPYMDGVLNSSAGANAPSCVCDSAATSHPFPESGVAMLPHGFRCFGMASNLDACLTEPAGDCGLADAEFLRDLRGRFASVVKTDSVVDVKRSDFRGHVYDLQSPFGFVVGNGIFLGNCTLIPIVRPPSRANAPDPPPVFRQNQGALIPDGDSYGAWWKQADDRRRKIAVGVKRYLTMLDRLQREPDWIEFMDPDTGGLLSVEQLKAETVSERNERVGRMRAVIGERREELERVAMGV